MFFESDVFDNIPPSAVLAIAVDKDTSFNNQAAPHVNIAENLEHTVITLSGTQLTTINSNNKFFINNVEYATREDDWDYWGEGSVEDEIQRVEVNGYTLSSSEILFELWLHEMKFSDFLTDPRNDYFPDPIEGAVYYDNKCTHATHTSPGTAPAGVDLNSLRNAVNAAADEIRGENQKIEHLIVFVWDPVDKELVRMNMIHGSENSVSGTIPLVPGDRIVATIHNHPYIEGNLSETWRPSSPGDKAAGVQIDDLTWASNLLKSGAADPNALMYILQGTKNGDGGIYEYTFKGELGKRPKGPNISDDCN